MGRLISKEPWAAAILSLMLPGAGHVYAGRAHRGLVLFCGAAVAGIVITAYALEPSTRLGLPFILIAVVFLATFNLYVPIDAYRSAKTWNLQHDAPRRPRWQRGLHIAASLLLLLLLDPRGLIAHYVSLYMVNNVVRAFEIRSDSMAPTLLIHDRVLVDKRFYRSREPRRGDLVVFRYPPDPNRAFLKRIVGLPGERIELSAGVIRINGRPLKDSYAMPPGGDRGCSGGYGPAVVSVDSFFVLSDDWCTGEDSRYFGFVPRGSLIGKVTKIYYPFHRSGPVQ
jgi:signal peptidase I